MNKDKKQLTIVDFNDHKKLEKIKKPSKLKLESKTTEDLITNNRKPSVSRLPISKSKIPSKTLNPPRWNHSITSFIKKELAINDETGAETTNIPLVVNTDPPVVEEEQKNVTVNSQESDIHLLIDKFNSCEITAAPIDNDEATGEEDFDVNFIGVKRKRPDNDDVEGRNNDPTVRSKRRLKIQCETLVEPETPMSKISMLAKLLGISSEKKYKSKLDDIC